jgi:hypothetical protein
LECCGRPTRSADRPGVRDLDFGVMDWLWVVTGIILAIVGLVVASVEESCTASFS